MAMSNEVCDMSEKDGRRAHEETPRGFERGLLISTLSREFYPYAYLTSLAVNAMPTDTTIATQDLAYTCPCPCMCMHVEIATEGVKRILLQDRSVGTSTASSSAPTRSISKALQQRGARTHSSNRPQPPSGRRLCMCHYMRARGSRGRHAALAAPDQQRWHARPCG